jgi:hypothetical protein
MNEFVVKVLVMSAIILALLVWHAYAPAFADQNDNPHSHLVQEVTMVV